MMLTIYSFQFNLRTAQNSGKKTTQLRLYLRYSKSPRFTNNFFYSLAKIIFHNSCRLERSQSQFSCYFNLLYKFRTHIGEQNMYNCQ